MADVKEMKEVLVAVMAIAKAMASASKDGLDLSDFASLISNEEVKAAIALAATGVTNVPEEIKDLDLTEGLELVMAVIVEIPALIESFKK